MNKYDIFISYRRTGGDIMAHNIFEYLGNKGYLIFQDIESLHSGKFNIELYKVIEQCNDFILILPPNGLDRCINEDDWVRKEISYAIKTNKNIIPVCLPGFEWPEELPQEISDVKTYNSIIINMENYDDGLKKLVSFLKSKKDIHLPDSNRQSVRVLVLLVLLILYFFLNLAPDSHTISHVGLIIIDIILSLIIGICWQRFMKVVFMKLFKDRLKASMLVFFTTLILIGVLIIVFLI